MESSVQNQFDLIDKARLNSPHPISMTYTIGTLSLRLLFSDSTLAAMLTRALNHLRIDPLPHTDLSIYVSATDTESGPLPPLDWNLIHRNGYRGCASGGVYLHYFEGIEALSALDIDKKWGYYIVKIKKLLPWWVGGSPFQAILNPWLRHKGMQLTHTAAVCNEKSAVLLSGKGGSGKSTTTLSCLSQGLHSLGEDYCILAPGEIPQVFSVYQSAKWERKTRRLFPSFENQIVNPDTADLEKALIFYEDIFPKQIRASSVIDAIVSLKVGTKTMPQIDPVDKETALKDLMMSTAVQLPFSDSQTMFLLRTLVSKLKTYRLILGSDLEANTQAIQKIL